MTMTMTTTEIINLTPHPITLRDSAGAVYATIPPSGTVARVEEQVRRAEPLRDVVAVHADRLGHDRIREIRTTYASPVGHGLPQPDPGRWLVVSLMQADAADALGRSTGDLLIPGQQTRDESGRVNGCATLMRYQPMRARLMGWDCRDYAARALLHSARMVAMDCWQAGLPEVDPARSLEVLEVAEMVATAMTTGAPSLRSMAIEAVRAALGRLPSDGE